MAEGAQHGASDEVRCAAYSTGRPPGAPQSPVGQPHTPDPNFCTLHAHD